MNPLTLYQVNVSPPELQGAEPFVGFVSEPPDIPAHASPPLSPAAELSSLFQALSSSTVK